MSGRIPSRMTKNRTPGTLALFLGILVCMTIRPASAGASDEAPRVAAEMVASVKESGNVLMYTRSGIRNRLPISLETVRLVTSDQVEMIDVRDSDERLMQFSQEIGNGRNEILIQPREAVPVGESLGLFTVSLHKNLVQEREDALVFEHEYTPDVPTVLRYTAIIPPMADLVSVEPKPEKRRGRRFSWEFDLEANQPFACRVKYTQGVPFGLEPVMDEADLESFGSGTMGLWRGSNIGAGWAWYYTGGRPGKKLLMPQDFRVAIQMKYLSAIDEKRRFGFMLDSTGQVSFDPRAKGDIEDPWGNVAYCMFWSNCDAENNYAYGMLRDGRLVKSKEAPSIELKRKYEIALEKEGNEFRLLVDGEKVFEYTDESLVETRQRLKFGVHDAMNPERIKILWEDKKYKSRGREIIDNLEWTFVGYSKPVFTLIGGDKELLEYRKRIKPVDTINTWTNRAFNEIQPIFHRMNGFDEADFSPSDSLSFEEVYEIDLAKFGFTQVASGTLEEIDIGSIHYEVPPESRSSKKLVSYSRKGSPEPVLFVQGGKTPREIQALNMFLSIRNQTNWGGYNAYGFSHSFYPHQASMGIRKGRWLLHVSLPLKEGESSELEGKWDTIERFQTSIAARILMHFYKLDMNAQ